MAALITRHCQCGVMLIVRLRGGLRAGVGGWLATKRKEQALTQLWRQEFFWVASQPSTGDL
ncbi:hypothetical protein [Promicromonospora sp. NPDC090134]|uniref:hypothetical protein n=1 Tax=Promicromonospora sp. NPDC090134 TaxID=3364408 RepID=UPI00381F70DC